MIILKKEDAERIALKICSYMNTSRRFALITETLGAKDKPRLMRFFATLTAANYKHLKSAFHKDCLLPESQLGGEAIAILTLFAKKTEKGTFLKFLEKSDKKIMHQTKLNVIEFSEFVGYIMFQANTLA